MSRFSAATLGRVALVSSLYLTVWLGFDYLATSYGHGPINPWYLGAALSFYLLYTFGVRYAPLVLIVEILRYFIIHTTATASLLFYIAFGTIVMVGYALAARVARNNLKINLPFIGVRDAARYCCLAAGAPLIVGVPIVALTVLWGVTPLAQAFNRLITFWIGDSVGLFVLVPVLAAYLTPRVAPWTVSPEARDDDVPISLAERFVLYTVLVAALLLGYATVLLRITQHPVLYFTFLPLVYIASRGGLRLAVPAIVLADATTLVLNSLVSTAGTDALELQCYIAVSSMTALGIGALVNDHHRRERSVQLEALRDPHTGLANRSSLESWLTLAATPLTVVTFDVDRMKLANDGLSRLAGDELLGLIAQRLHFLEASFVAQTGPEQFACVFDGDEEPADLAKRVVSLFDDPFAIDDSEVFIAAAMGIAVALNPSDRAGVLIRADVAMYRARRSNRGGFTTYTAEMESSEANISLASGLHRAFREGEFVLYYQPLFSVEDSQRRCIGVEALLRWKHPALGVLEPAAFLDLLESLALAEKVGLWVLNESCRQLREWTDKDIDISMLVNLFPRQAIDPEFPNDVTSALLKHSIRPDRLVLEVVERVFSEDEHEVGESIRQLRSLGVQIAIDDFGTGHSSLARLRESPAHILKIDGSFITRSEFDPRARAVIHAVLQIADELHLKPLAEGIENATQLRLVNEQGCKLVQGYYLARPMPATQVEELLLRTPRA